MQGDFTLAELYIMVVFNVAELSQELNHMQGDFTLAALSTR